MEEKIALKSDQIESLKSIGVGESLREEIREWVENIVNNFIQKGDVDALRFVEKFSESTKAVRRKIEAIIADDREKKDIFYEKLRSIRRALMGGFEITNILGKPLPFEVFPPGSSFESMRDSKKNTNKKEKDHSESFPRKYWTILALKGLGVDFTIRQSKERRDGTEPYLIFIIPEYECVMAVANEYGKATYFLPMNDWQSFAQSKKIDDLRSDKNVRWMAMPSDVSKREDWKNVLPDYLLEMQILAEEVGPEVKFPETKLSREEYLRKKMNTRADELLCFIKENKRIPQSISKKASKKTVKQKEESSLQKFYQYNKDNTRISEDRRSELRRLWKKYSPRGNEWNENTLIESVNALMKFINTKTKLPSQFANKDLMSLTNQERYEKFLGNFYSKNKDNLSIPKIKRKEMTDLWSLYSPLKNEFNKKTFEERGAILIKFMEDEKRIPKSSKKSVKDLTDDENYERVLINFYNSHKVNEKNSLETRNEMKELWETLTPLQKEEIHDASLEEQADALIEFMETKRRVPSKLKSKDKNEKYLNWLYKKNKDNPDLSILKRKRMNELWEELNPRINNWNRKTLEQKACSIIDFIENNARIPQQNPSLKDLEALVEGKMHSFYRNHENNLKISDQVRTKMINIWEKFSQRTSWAKQTPLEKVEHLLSFLMEKHRTPTQKRKKIEDMTEEEKYETRLYALYLRFKKNEKISQEKRNEMTKLWEQYKKR